MAGVLSSAIRKDCMILCIFVVFSCIQFRTKRTHSPSSLINRDLTTSAGKLFPATMKELLGFEYTDYNLGISLEEGKLCEHKVIEKAFKRLIKNNNLPPVVFHSLRHSSATYKLKLNNGDLKATQGDTGYAQTSTLTEIYAHILDEDRKITRKILSVHSMRILTCGMLRRPKKERMMKCL